MANPFKTEVLVLGAGAAGCFAAIESAKGGRGVLLLDHGKEIGGKIPISGGGRCNFTNLGADWTHYQGENPRFAASALSRYTPQDFIRLVDSHGIAWHEKHLGQLFCDGKAQQIVDLLKKEVADAGVQSWLGCEVMAVEQASSGFRVETARGIVQAQALVVATGGLSYPSLGATPLGLQLARQFGHAVMDTAPALDGFAFGPREKEDFKEMQGLALENAKVEAGGKAFSDSILFTHRGLSGPAALQASLYWRPGMEVAVDLWPHADLEGHFLAAKRASPGQSPLDLLAPTLPRRLAARWIQLHLPGRDTLGRVSDGDLRMLAQGLRRFSFKPASTVGYHRAEVTRGGVDTAELNQKTLESKKIPGLYFIGEVVDITGELGGYNFQWAWSSGWAAGQALAAV